MRIGLDAMGGDHAPHEIVRGAAAALRHLAPDDELRLYGPHDVIEQQCIQNGVPLERVSITHCTEVIEMEDLPVEALRQKRNSTIVRLAVAAGAGELDAVISAGNTGAFAAACQLKIKPIRGVSRPGIAVVLPTFHGPVVICDVGANVAPKPHHLHDYARMAACYARAILGIARPRVGLMSIGEEQGKGNPLVKEAHQLIKQDSSLHFIGNMEGKDIFAGQANVFICDGFVGNVILKLTEGLAEGLFKTIVREIGEEGGPDLARRFQPIVERIWARHDFAEYGGAPLLGINSIAIICHGRSDHRAIGNAIRVAHEQFKTGLNNTIADQLEQHEVPA
jgi:glycerol-3-phosphate acyltransferase PlsX